MWVVLLIHRNLLYNPPMRNCLEVDSIMKSFGEKTVLTDIYLRCEPGEIIALFGWNGCGKSTLLHIIFGTLPCERKFIRINGKVQNKPAYRSGLIAYLPQHDFLPGNLSVKKVAHLYLSQEDEHLFSMILVSNTYERQNKRVIRRRVTLSGDQANPMLPGNVHFIR